MIKSEDFFHNEYVSKYDDYKKTAREYLGALTSLTFETLKIDEENYRNVFGTKQSEKVSLAMLLLPNFALSSVYNN